jgi:CubicO group peptidase (beta-lactamase class C family)
MASGGAGALSTAGDYLRFTRMLLSGGTLDGVRILSPASVRLMTADHLGHAIATPISPGEAAMQSPGYGFGLGVAVRLADGLASVPGSAGDYFWSGSAATGFWVDPREDLAAVFMAQTPGAMRLRLRRLLRQLVYQAL